MTGGGRAGKRALKWPANGRRMGRKRVFPVGARPCRAYGFGAGATEATISPGGTVATVAGSCTAAVVAALPL